MVRRPDAGPAEGQTRPQRPVRSPSAPGPAAYAGIAAALLVAASVLFFVASDRALRGETEIPSVLRATPSPPPLPTAPPLQSSTAGDRPAVSIDLAVPADTAEAILTPTLVPVRTDAPDPYFLYEVEPGDSLNSIAARFRTSFEELAGLNGIDEPWVIRIGDELLIPNR